MKRFTKLLSLLFLLVAILALTTLVGSAESVCTHNGVEYNSLENALSVAQAGDIITLNADVTKPVRIEKEVTIIAGEHELVWYSSRVSPTVVDGTYTFAAATEFSYVDWYVGHRNEGVERLTYTVGSVGVYYGGIPYGDYEVGDNFLKLSKLVDETGATVDIPVIEAPGQYFTRRVMYTSDTPRFKLVLEDGTEKIYYISTDLASVAEAAPNNATIVLLSDIFYPYYSDGQTAARGISVKVSGGKHLNFDFAGYDIIAETKITMFEATDSGVVLNPDGSQKLDEYGNPVTRYSSLDIYSSQPEANLFLGQKNSDSYGGCVLMSRAGTTINFGDHGEYSGKNINTYSACFVNLYSYSVVNVSGASIYRMIKDWVGFIYCRSGNSTLNIKDARVFGVNRDIQFAFGSKGTVAKNVNVTVENTLFATLAMPDQTYSGNFIRYISDGVNVQFKNCAFDRIPFSVETYTKSTDETVPKVSVHFDKNCSFEKLPNVDRDDIFKFDKIPSYDVKENTPDCVYVNDITTYPIKYGQFNNGADHDYELKEYETEVGGRVKFTNSGYEEEATEIIWYYNNEAIPEWWELGSTPYPFSINIPTNSKFVEYIVGDLTPVYEGASYDIVAKRKFPVKFNMTLSSKLKVNVYVPVYEDINLNTYVQRVSVGTNTISAQEITNNLKPITLDGEKYYKIVFEYDYFKVPKSLNIILEISGARGAKSFSEYYPINVANYAKDFLTGDYSDDLKADIKGLMYKIVDSYTEKKTTPPKEFKELIAELFENEAN